jgi:hypothetical protein
LPHGPYLGHQGAIPSFLDHMHVRTTESYHEMVMCASVFRLRGAGTPFQWMIWECLLCLITCSWHSWPSSLDCKGNLISGRETKKAP